MKTEVMFYEGESWPSTCGVCSVRFVSVVLCCHKEAADPPHVPAMFNHDLYLKEIIKISYYFIVRNIYGA